MCISALAGLASVGAGIVQGNISNDRQNRAKSEYEQGAAQARAELEKSNAMFQPYAEAGKRGLDLYQKYLNEPVENSPMFQQKERLLKQRLASTGENLSPGLNSQSYIDLMRSEETDRLNRLMPLINAGQYGMSNMAQGNRSIGDLYQNTGQMRGQTEVNTTPNFAGNIGSAFGLYQNMEEMNSLNKFRQSYLNKGTTPSYVDMTGFMNQAPANDYSGWANPYKKKGF